MLEEITRLRQAASEMTAAAADAAALEQVRVELIGRRHGRIGKLFEALKSLPESERRKAGAALNALKQYVQEALDARRRALAQPAAPAPIDVSLPGAPILLGRRHPLSLIRQELIDIFTSLGFSVAEGPEVETEWYNFDALNIPPEHPARDAFDTFFLEDGHILRSQTSTVQIRLMEKTQPPIRVIAPGRVFRPDAVDASHHHTFHQLEGLAVDAGVTFADLKGVLGEFARALYGPAARTRFRPSFFPFTEPSAEMDVSCSLCGRAGCQVCKYTGWVELLGCGMVDPNVFEAVGYDAGVYSGFAFGMGIERLAMTKYGIADIRLFLENDLRFVRQF